MAYLTQRARGRWELRESVSTDRGPRSRTLATFERLSDEVLEHAAARATRGFDPDAVRADARRKAIPFELPPAEQAARDLAGLLAHGATVSPAIAAILRDLLDSSQVATPSDAALAAAQWIGATTEDRAAALEDLLLLADALPMPHRADQPQFPRLVSTGGDA